MDWPFIGRENQIRQIVAAIQGPAGSAVLQGDLGVGKTRLARVVADTLRSRGWHVEVCIGSAAAAPIPFGALSHLVLRRSSGDVVLDLEQMRREVMARARGAPLLFLVDDANFLDGGSMALVHRLAATGDAAVLATRRTGETGNSEALTSLWKDGFADLFEVLALDRASHDRLVATSLGAVRAAGLLDHLWQLTQGNPLFLRELVGAAIDGSLESWLDSDEAPAAPLARLTEIIGAKVRQLPESVRAALEIVALAEPVRVEIVSRLSDREALTNLQERSIVAIDHLGSMEHARTTHPIYGATIRAMVPSLRKATLATALADALIDQGLREPGDALRAAVWLLQAGSLLPADLATRAATEALARGEALLAERFAALALESEEKVSALIALGTAMSVQHRAKEAEAVLERALELADGEEERARAALACSRHHAWVGRDFLRGTAVLEDMIPTLSDASAKSELRAELAFFSAAAGDAVTTVRIAQDVLSDPGASPAAVLSSLIHSTRARIMLGLFDGLGQDLDRGESLALELRPDLPLALDQLCNNRALWLRFVDFTEARRVASVSYERSLREGGPSGMWSGTLSWLSLDAGDADAALGLVRRSLSEMERFDPFHNLLMGRSLAALIHAVRGETDAGRKWLENAGPLEGMEPRSRVWAERSAVWLAAGTPEHAASLAIAAGERAEAQTITTWGAALLYHDAVRLGHASLAAAPLRRLSDATTAPLIGIMADHATAADSDADELARVAHEFEARGSPLLAAEALAQAAQASDPAGTACARFRVRAVVLALACPGAATPLIKDLDPPLTEREWEIAQLACEGESSRDIAERVFVSVRTVDNHLASVYRKLGLSGRQDLTSLFALEAPHLSSAPGRGERPSDDQ